VFVTHDQEEALTMSDRVAVMNGGRVEQAGSPREVYEEPSTVFVADFLGVSNLLTGEASADGTGCALRVGERTFRAQQGATGSRGEVKAMIRPERIAVEGHGAAGENRLPGLVERAVFLGQRVRAPRACRRRRRDEGDDAERRLGNPGGGRDGRDAASAA
jgi:ABC-type Fe3+/spermidine/putrescine transport system ATPase subunit